MTETRLRLWETPRIGVENFGVDPSDEPEPQVRLSESVAIRSGPTGFTLSNVSSTDITVLATLMAETEGADESEARSRLAMLTSTIARSEPLWITSTGADDAYTRLWKDDIYARPHSAGGWVAMRSGAIVIELSATSSFELTHDDSALELGVVVASVAAAATGLGPDGMLVGIARGASASIGELPLVLTRERR